MDRYIPPEKMTIEQIQIAIDKDFDRWNTIATKGCQDPFWPDGCNMNLVRNHIINWYRLLAEKLEEDTQTSLFSLGGAGEVRPIPPEVSDNLMIIEGTYADRLKHRVHNDLVWVHSGELKA